MILFLSGFIFALVLRWFFDKSASKTLNERAGKRLIKHIEETEYLGNLSDYDLVRKINQNCFSAFEDDSYEKDLLAELTIRLEDRGIEKLGVIR